MLPFAFPIEASDIGRRILQLFPYNQLMLDIHLKQVLHSIIASDNIIKSKQFGDGATGIDFMGEFDHLIWIYDSGLLLILDAWKLVKW